MSKRWATICVLSIKGKVYAYQQLYYKDNRGKGKTVVPNEEHRMIPISETLTDENVRELVE